MIDVSYVNDGIRSSKSIGATDVPKNKILQ